MSCSPRGRAGGRIYCAGHQMIRLCDVQPGVQSTNGGLQNEMNGLNPAGRAQHEWLYTTSDAEISIADQLLPSEGYPLRRKHNS